MTRRAAALVTSLLTAATVVLGGCSGGLGGTGDANYVVGEGGITEVAVDDREAPVEISGESLQGEPINLADYRGQVVVLNFWGSWCTPCREEAPVLQDASEQLDAVFVGAQYREDNLADALSFEREFEITYPTLNDGGGSLLALGRFVPLGPPSTAVLDPEGRVAALITGVVPSVGTLETLVEEAAAEDG